MDSIGGAFGGHDAFGHLSYVLIAISYYVTRMVWLRAMAVLGLSLEIAYFHLSGGALGTGMAWNGVFIAINLYQLWRLAEHARNARHAPDRGLLRQGTLGLLDDAQLGRLLRLGSWRDFGQGAVLTREGHPVGEFYLLCQGHALVEVGNVAIARLAPGSFVGEIAFLSGKPACATVTVEEPARVFAVDPAGLRKLLADDEQIAAAMHRCMARDLAGKLRHDGDAVQAPFGPQPTMTG